MRLLILALFFLCLTTTAFSQNNYSIKGAIADSASNGKMQNTTICVLNAKDSTLYKFTRALPNGTFAISNLHKGKFLLLATYPEYADYVETFQLDSIKQQADFGKINMTLKSKLLTEVMIKGKAAAIKIKGDTTEFNASSFVVQPNAKVEDLLKQLPGITVDKDGKITAQGQTVNKVLVDGEEFFGDDPTLVTKNLRADMVDKVQLYDKTSDQAAFTGVDDGQKSKTINIKLKEDKKNGYFGKLDGGVGTDKYYQGQALFNKFTPKYKLSAYGTLANTGKTGLSWEDNNKFGTQGDAQVSDEGFIYFSGGGDDLDSFDGRYNNNGIPLARTAGIHYDTKWGAGNSQTLNANYKIGSLNVDGNNTTLTQTNIPGSLQNSNSSQDYHNYIFRQKVDLTYNLKIDTSTTLKLAVDGTLKHSQTKQNYTSSSYRNIDTLLNESNRSIINNVDTKTLNASALYSKKFSKKGRTFSASFKTSVNEVDTKGYLNSAIGFYNKTGSLDSTQQINEYKTSIGKNSVLSTNFTWSEPITKFSAVVFNYGVGVDNSSDDRKSLDQTPATGEYNRLNTLLSNNFQLNQFSNQGGINYTYKKAKTVFGFGTKVSDVSFDQNNSGSTFTRSFVNWNPQASYQYNFSQRNAIRVSYSGNTTQPTIDQLQPVFTNADPLNLILGNPDLKPSFSNRFRFSYNAYKVLSDQSLYISGSYSFKVNPIVTNTTTDITTGKTTQQAFNITNKNESDYYIYSSFGQKVNAIDINVGIELNANGNTSYNYSNSVLNTTKSNSYSAKINFSKYLDEKFDFNFAFGPVYNISSSSLQAINNNGYGFNGYSYFNLYLPGKFQIGYDANYDYTAKTQSFDQNFGKFILNASVSKKFLKEQNLKLSLSGNDLFNQNVGFSRDASGSTITQNTYTSIKRYFMISLTYDFSHFAGGVAKK